MSIIMPLPMLPAGGGNSSLLADYAKTPLEFGPPIYRSSAVISSGTREVIMGPRSPVRGAAALMASVSGEINGHGAGGVRMDGVGKKESVGGSSTLDGSVDDPSSSGGSSSSRTLIGTTPVASPSRKGKEAAQTPTKTALHTAASGSGVDLTWPAQLAGLKRAGAGLDNPSMACYANATLQVLLHTPPVLAKALAHNREGCDQLRLKGYCVLCAMSSLAARHFVQKEYKPLEIHNHLGKIRKGFNKHRQEDTHEFFRFMTDGLQATATVKLPKDTPEKIKQTTWVYKTWGGKVRSRVVCLRCKKPSDTFDSFLDLSLDVPKGRQPDVYQMMKGYCKEDKLSGDNKYHCENCKSKSDATKSFRIAEIPPVLTLVLKRFRINYNPYSGRPRADKYNEFIDYPELLDVSPYMVDPNVPGTKYRLFGVTCHRGADLKFGHYTSYVRGPDGRWHNADDADVDVVPTKSALNAKTAYLLSYIRISEAEYANGHKRTPTPSGTPVATPSTIGWSVPSPQAGPASPSGKRKFENGTPDMSSKKDFPARQAGKGSSESSGTWAKEFTAASREHSPSPPIEPSGEEVKSPFANSRYAPIQQSSFYGKSPKLSRKEERREERRSKKHKSPAGKRSHASPYKVQQGPRGKGLIGRMKPRH